MKHLLFLSSFFINGLIFSQTNPTNCFDAMSDQPEVSTIAKNVFGNDLMACCYNPKTGYYRDGFCHTGAQDYGVHIACAVMTKEFLAYTKAKGNDLSSSTPWFPGLKPGDNWCLCISRWIEAMNDGVAPPLILEATHEKALDYVSLKVLKKYSFVENRN